MKLDNLLTTLDYEILSGDTTIYIDNIYDDSRRIKAGGLFFCITGSKTDGHKYIREAIKNGAKALVVERDEIAKEAILTDGVTVVKVRSTRYAMGIMSATFYGNPSDKLTVIGITGTKGKTTTTYMLREMLEMSGIPTGLIGTIEVIDGETHIPAKNTTPESIALQKHLHDMVNNGIKAVVMEVSSQGLMLDRVAGINFSYGVFTNLARDHIGPNEHSSFEEYIEWKSKLFTMCKVGIINTDDEYADRILKNASCKIISYGISKAGYYDYGASDYSLYKEEGTLGINYILQGRKKGEIKLALPGEFSARNSLAAIAIADIMGVTFSNIKSILESIKVRGRVEMIPISDDFTIMIDYAHNAVAMESLYQALKMYKPERLISVFGCGGNRSKDRRYEMGEVSGNMADLTIITSDNPRYENPGDIIKDIRIGIEKTNGKYIEIPDRKEAIRYAILNAKAGDLIVLAGKGHEDYQEIMGVYHHMDERELIREILEEEDATKICGYNNRYFA